MIKSPLSVLLALVLSSVAFAAESYQIAVIPKGTTHEYWKSIYAGAIKAKEELAGKGINLTIFWKGPLREDDREQQIQVVEDFVGRQVSGIVLAPLDNRALVTPVEEAASANIPVVIIDSSLRSNKIASFIATDNKEGGRIAARRLGELLGGKGKVIMLRYAVGSASTEDREAGFLEAMKKDFPQIELISTEEHAGATRDTAKRASENLLNRFGSEVNGIFACNESAATGMLLALRDAGLAGGKVKFVAFDSGTVLDEGLLKGDIQGLVVQNPFKMGYLGVINVVKAIKGEKVEARIDTGVGLVTPQNMNEPAEQELLHPPISKYSE